jgi:exonuclease SbcD
MKILHTSDWHLGQVLMGRSREEEHLAFLAWLGDTAESERPDVLIVAGDVFDTGTPPNYALQMYYDFLTRMHGLGIETVVVGGNHDSVASLAAPRSLLRTLGITVIAGGEEENTLVSVSRDGELVGVVCAVPFLRESVVRRSRAALSAADREHALAEGIRAYYTEIHARALELTEGRDVPVVATGHLTTLGAKQGDSEREIYIGNVLDISAAFLQERFDYTALGHLHRHQRVGTSDVWYSGAPLPMSFAEARQRKYVNRVTFEGRNPTVEALEIPVFRPLLPLRGNRQALTAALEAVEDPRTWIEAQLEDDNPHAAAQALYETAAARGLELLAVKVARSEAALHAEEAEVASLDDITPEEVFAMRLAQEGISDEKLAKDVTAAFRAVAAEVGLS